MKRHFIIALISVLVIVITGIFLSRRKNSTAVPIINLIKTSLPQCKDFKVTEHFFGKAYAKNKVTITALEAGMIFSVDVADESFVKKGDVIFTLGGARINASTAAIKQKIESLKQQQSLAESTLSRKQQAREQRIASFDELDKAKVTLANLNTQLKEAVGQLQALEDAIRIKSQISGIFTNRKVNAGQNVEKADVLAEIIDPNNLRIAATLFPSESAQLQGCSAAIHTAGGKILSGVIISVLAQRTSAGGTMAWLESDDINEKLKPGDVVSGDVQLTTHKKALAIPEKAIVRDEQEKTYVFIKQTQGYTKQQVRTGLSSNEWVEVLSGLAESDEVVTEDAYELFYQDFNKVYKVAD
ncbi:MAG TPA: efflux RND transporter periplasmic adaptor subunit [Phycisphaerales bacterium]|nr:efflux RND transporter periplasmic adaptor subunit [Phycisphaerales bacterium]